MIPLSDMRTLAILIFIFLASFIHTSVVLAQTRVESPDGKVVIAFLMQAGGTPAYTIEYQGKPVVLESRMGFETGLIDGFELGQTTSDAHDSEWIDHFGERKIVPDRYHEMDVDLKSKSGRVMRIVFRAYNEGAAFRYSFPGQAGDKPIEIDNERTEFRLPENTFGYEEHGTEGEYRRVKISEFQPWCERPLTLEYADGKFASLAEADNENFPRMLLSPLKGVPGALVSALGGPSANLERGQREDPHAKLAPDSSTPWRLLIVGDKPGDLLERDYLLLDLNPPTVLKNTSWIKPGKAMRDTTLTTTNAKAIIDFAATGGLQYVGFDWHWYGSEDLVAGDATTVRIKGLDLPEVIRYGASKNVGVIVYVDRKQIKSQRDKLFQLYEQWGLKGVKIGFVDVGPQEETAWITETIQKAAEHHLLLDIHDGYRPTGYIRTYPNLLTVEGIRGNEHMPTAQHNATLPFTRYIAGPGDYTVCYYTKRKQTTFAHQLAMSVVAFSPMQWLYWYDKPSDSQNEPELEFFREVPTVWDDTRVINGKIGEYASIARQSGDDWFIGTINGGDARTLQLPLSFLIRGRSYTANIYSDDDSVSSRTHVGIERKTVDSTASLEMNLKPSGGQAVWITPVKN
jgi:alpha-glucosidase